MSKSIWNPDSVEQYTELRSFAETEASRLNVRDWEDCYHDALTYLLHRTRKRRYSLGYVRLMISRRIYNETLSWFNRRVFPSTEIENFPEGASATQSTNTFTAA